MNGADAIDSPACLMPLPLAEWPIIETILPVETNAEAPACLMPAPASEQPVIETEGFIPVLSGDAPQEPACDMPVPLNQRDLLGLVVGRPPTEVAGDGGDWLSALIGGPETIVACSPGYVSNEKADATFALWYGLLGGGDSAGDALIVAKAEGDAVPSLVVSSLTQNNMLG